MVILEGCIVSILPPTKNMDKFFGPTFLDFRPKKLFLLNLMSVHGKKNRPKRFGFFGFVHISSNSEWLNSIKYSEFTFRTNTNIYKIEYIFRRYKSYGIS